MSRIRADQLVNRAGSGGPKFPNGVAEGFSVSGVVTATSFTGNVTGNADIATNAQGLTGTPNITVGTIGCGNVTSTGDVTGVNATFSGNLTVQGTTTTIDTAITEVDSLNVEGSVGIGTTNPGAKLEVRDSNSQGIIIRSNSTQATDSNKAIRVRNNSDTNTFHVSHKGQGYFAGYVGMGTDNPSVKLHVHEGTIRTTNTAKTNFVELGTDGNIEIKKNGGGAYIDFADDINQDYDVRIQEVSDGLKFITGGSGSASERLRIGSSGEIGLSGANYGTAGQVLTSQGSGSAPQWATPASGTSAGARSTNPNTTLVEWTSLPANIQTIEVGYADAYASTNNAENERIVLRLGTSAGYLTSNYKNRSWNMYASAVGLGFNSSRAAFIPYYWIDNTDRATNMFILRRMGTSNTFQATWQEYIAGGHSYIAMGTGYIDLGAELTQVRLQTINNTANLNGSFWMNYTTR